MLVLPCNSNSKESACNAGDQGSKILWRREWQFTPVFLPGESHGQRTLLGYSPWGNKPFRYDLNQLPYDYTVEVRNRFKGLDLIDRVPDELWNEVCDIVQETEIKTIPIEKKCKKAKWLSEEVLQNSCEKKRSEKQRRKGKI